MKNEVRRRPFGERLEEGRETVALSLALFLCFSACGGGGRDPYGGSCPESVDCSLPGVSLMFALDSEGFFDRPWPADARLSAEGLVEVAGFPNPEKSSLLSDWLEVVGRTTRGFGTNAAIYFTFNGALNTAGLPLGPEESQRADAKVFLLDISEGPHAGERLPLEITWWADERQFTPAYTLVLRPAESFPLRSHTRYAAVVLREVNSASGNLLGATADFERTKYAQPPTDERLRAWWETLQPGYRALERLAGIARGRVAALSVFTTQEVAEEMDRVRDFVRGQPAPALSEWRHIGSRSALDMYEAWFDMPQFQAGQPPDFSGGGGFVFDEQGRPVVQRTERMAFNLSVPKGESPASGWPVVIYHHGTGGDRFSFCGVSNDDECDWFAERGLAGIGISQPLHGERNTGGWDETSVTFNIQNLEAFRDNFRQGAAELLLLEKLVEGLVVPASVAVGGKEIHLDGRRLAFMGHSQGGITGPIFLGSAVSTRGAMLSASGGGLGIVVLERKNPVDIRALLVMAMGLEDAELDLDHPVINIFQTFAERADPINYGRRLLLEPAGVEPRHVFFTEGLLDEMTMPRQIEDLAAAAGCAPLEPVARMPRAMSLRGVGALTPPARGNASGPTGQPITAVLSQFPNDGHFAVYYNATARKQAVEFLDTLLHDPPPTVGNE